MAEQSEIALVGGDSAPKWDMLEFQGTFLLRGVAPECVDCGEIVCETKRDGKVVPGLNVGNQRVEGAKVALKRPMLVLRKETDGAGRTQYRVEGIVRDKTHFMNRPILNKK